MHLQKFIDFFNANEAGKNEDFLGIVYNLQTFKEIGGNKSAERVKRDSEELNEGYDGWVG